MGVEPTLLRVTAGSRCRFGFGHSASTWNRTRNSDFGDPRDVPFTIEATTSVPRPGIEPGPRLSKSRVMSPSPPGQTDPGAGVEPALTGSESAVLPVRRPRKRSVAHRGFDPLWPVRETGDLTRSRMGLISDIIGTYDDYPTPLPSRYTTAYTTDREKLLPAG